MKTQILFFALLALSVLSPRETLHSQWTPGVTLTTTTASQFGLNNATSLVCSGNNVYMVYAEYVTSAGEIFFKRSTNGGANWLANVQLTTDNYYPSEVPSLAVVNSGIYVVWADRRDGNWEIYFKSSGNGGQTWGGDVRLTNNSSVSGFPSISYFGNSLHVCWQEERDGNKEVYYKKTTNGGVNWTADTRLTNNSAASMTPTVKGGALGSYAHIVWVDDRDGNREIYYKRSTNEGTSWSVDTRLTNNSSASDRSNITVSGFNVYVFWDDNRDGNLEIYFKKSTDLGASWGADTRLTNASSTSAGPSVIADGSNIHIVWTDSRTGWADRYYKRSLNNGTTWEPDYALPQYFGNWEDPHIAAGQSGTHIVHLNGTNTNYEIIHTKNPNNNPTGINTIGSEIPEKFNLSQNYPNPFNPVTKIEFSIPKSGNVKLSVFDVSGKLINELVNGNYNAGTYKVDYNASDLSSGTYFYRIETEGFTETKKMMLVK